MREKALNYLGLMRKAGMLEAGEQSVGAAVRYGKARLLLLAQGAGDNARRRAHGFSESSGVPIAELPFTKDEISQRIGKANTVMAAVTDAGFAAAFADTLSKTDPEFEPLRLRLEEKLSKKAHSGNKGTRRNKA